jgi:hypothetical protein
LQPNFSATAVLAGQEIVVATHNDVYWLIASASTGADALVVSGTFTFVLLH